MTRTGPQRDCHNQTHRRLDDAEAKLAALTGPLVADAWARSGRSAPLVEPDEWDGFALVIRALMDRAAIDATEVER